ncbi:MAG: hypothetical protein SV375_21215 [Thermodesulfobacteriota bacterium]|nr:hypothetical protein [Thermodesulfobacteriota bacterium]
MKILKISIIPGGISALGYTIQVTTEDPFFIKKTELLNKIATLPGGRAPEEMSMGSVSEKVARKFGKPILIIKGEWG